MANRFPTLGYTFIEVLVAMTVLGIIAFAAMPQLSAGNPEKLDFAAAEVASAIRFARSEAMRTREVHAVFVDEVNEEVTVELMDMTTKPASVDEVLYHPVRKQPYTFNLSKIPAMQNVLVESPAGSFLFTGIGKQQRLMFSADGVPVFVDTFTGTVYQLVTAKVLLGLKGLYSSVGVQPITGRVTIS